MKKLYQEVFRIKEIKVSKYFLLRRWYTRKNSVSKIRSKRDKRTKRQSFFVPFPWQTTIRRWRSKRRWQWYASGNCLSLFRVNLPKLQLAISIFNKLWFFKIHNIIFRKTFVVRWNCQRKFIRFVITGFWWWYYTLLAEVPFYINGFIIVIVIFHFIITIYHHLVVHNWKSRILTINKIEIYNLKYSRLYTIQW